MKIRIVMENETVITIEAHKELLETAVHSIIFTTIIISMLIGFAIGGSITSYVFKTELHKQSKIINKLQNSK